MVEVGFTFMLADVCPPLHRYVFAPLAVIVAEFPEQTLVEVAATFGKVLTVTVEVAVEEHAPLLPVTV